MYPCPSCHAGLRFDIEKQLLVCDHCDSKYDPYEIGREKDAVEHDYFETTVFTCPQCGGELISDDTTAATFCSYCGGTTILDSRISKEKRPAFIIPFRKTKEECKEAYSQLVKGAKYAPDAFKDPELLEKFRGIYMPYWVYDFETDAEVSFEGSTSHRHGDYIDKDYYRVSGPVQGVAEGITYDASSTFLDSMSRSIAPYDIKMQQSFTPSLLSGFYADTGYVDKALYADDASDMVVRYNASHVEKSSVARSMTISGSDKDSIKEQVTPSLKDAKYAMLPVWFLAYKTRDNRVAYAAVNGQTGKITADLPVDKGKFLKFTAITALIVFAILSLLTSTTVFSPGFILVLVMLIAIIILISTSVQLKSLANKEENTDDQGILFRKEMEKLKNKSEDPANQEGFYNYVASDNDALRCAAIVNKGQAKEKGKLGCGGVFAGVGISILILFAAMLASDFIIESQAIFGVLSNIAVLAVYTVAIYIIIRIWSNAAKTGNPVSGGRKLSIKSFWKNTSLLKLVFAIVVAAAVLILEPVQDMYYYGAAIICIVMTVISEFELIDRHNKLTTNKPPQLGVRGGDEDA